MARLTISVMDVGWGDSILVEAEDDTQPEPVKKFGLIDCNDYSRQRISQAFIKRYLELAGRRWKDVDHNFEWVILTHPHDDHMRGLKQILLTFGTKHFWYPQSNNDTATFGALLSYVSSSQQVQHHQSIDETKVLAAPEVDFAAEIDVIWPNHGVVPESNENLNSVVLVLSLGDARIVLTGDAEASVWQQELLDRLPAHTSVFQSPHHGALNGVFDGGGTPWLDVLNPTEVAIVMSSHVVPHGHPHQAVVNEMRQRGFTVYRTDQHHNVVISTNGAVNAAGRLVDIKYSHVSGIAP